jgi:hypothetical protein
MPVDSKVLPTELWLHIASFLPGIIVAKLMSLNRTFFYLGMQELYREVEIGFDDVWMGKTSSRLQ